MDWFGAFATVVSLVCYGKKQIAAGAWLGLMGSSLWSVWAIAHDLRSVLFINIILVLTHGYNLANRS